MVRCRRRHLGGLGAASIPPQACAGRAGGRRLGAEPGGAACWPREGGGGACSSLSAAWTAPAQAPLSALWRCGRSLVQLRGALGHGAPGESGRSDGSHLVLLRCGRRLGRVSSRAYVG